MEYYRHADWLGSSRLTSTPSRTVSGDVAYAPFGETYASSGSPSVSFSGQNADTDANLYDFMYREYGIQGRWPSPDPLGPGAFSLADPQSLNRYAYVLNNPETFIDPLGLHCGDPDSGSNGPSGYTVTGHSPCPVLNPVELTYCPAPGGSPLGNDGGVQPEPADVCRLEEGPLNDNMMGSSRGYGSEAEFSNALLQRVQNHPARPQTGKSPPPPQKCGPDRAKGVGEVIGGVALTAAVTTAVVIAAPEVLAGAAAGSVVEIFWGLPGPGVRGWCWRGRGPIPDV